MCAHCECSYGSDGSPGSFFLPAHAAGGFRVIKHRHCAGRELTLCRPPAPPRPPLCFVGLFCALSFVRPGAIETFESDRMVYLVLKLCTGGDLRTRAPYSEKAGAEIIIKASGACS